LAYVRVIKLRRMGWVIHVARMRGMRNSCILVKNRKEKGHIGDVGVEGKILLKFILKNQYFAV
jgi:hypothetical protein